MDTLMEFSIQGDIFFFYDTLSDEEKETVAELLLIDDDTILVNDELLKGLDKELDDEFLEGLERDHGIKLKRLSVTSVIAV